MFKWYGRRHDGKPRYVGNGRAGWLHAHSDGGAVLIEDSSWRTISGLYLNAFGGFLMVQWRRRS